MLDLPNHLYSIPLNKKCIILSPDHGTLRLYGGNTRYDGILEIYYSNRWGSICDDGWSSVASRVACRQMDYLGYSSYTTSRTITNDFWLDGARCSGNESSVESCRHSGWGNVDCASNEAIFLRCNAIGK